MFFKKSLEMQGKTKFVIKITFRKSKKNWVLFENIVLDSPPPPPLTVSLTLILLQNPRTLSAARLRS